jgi:hypothetical protein
VIHEENLNCRYLKNKIHISILYKNIVYCRLASNCNGKKYSAKRAGEQSSELYLTLYVGMHGPFFEEAVVVDVKDHSFDVLVLRTGSTHRVYTNVSYQIYY